MLQHAGDPLAAAREAEAAKSCWRDADPDLRERKLLLAENSARR